MALPYDDFYCYNVTISFFDLSKNVKERSQVMSLNRYCKVLIGSKRWGEKKAKVTV